MHKTQPTLHQMKTAKKNYNMSANDDTSRAKYLKTEVTHISTWHILYICSIKHWQGRDVSPIIEAKIHV